MKTADERAEAVTERPRASGEYLALRRSQPPLPPAHSKVGSSTYEARATSDLFRLCAAIGQEAFFEAYCDVLHTLFLGWGDRPIDENAPYPSGISEDHSPFAFGLTFSPRGLELRMLVEAQPKEPVVPSRPGTILALNRELAARYDVDFSRFAALREILFHGDQSDFSVWHAVRWSPAGRPAFKLHLKPRTRSVARDESLVRDALRLLGMNDGLESSFLRMTTRPGDTFRGLAFDLSRQANARVTVYAEHHGATADELEEIATLSVRHYRGDFRAFAAAMIGHEGPYLWRPVTTSASFVPGSVTPSSVALHLPISHYVDTDGAAAQRFARLLEEHHADALSYRRAVHVFAGRSLDADAGVHTFASFSRDADGTKLATWLSPEVFRRA